MLMKMKCLKPKTQKHKTNIVKYSCLYQENSALYILEEETISRYEGCAKKVEGWNEIYCALLKYIIHTVLP